MNEKIRETFEKSWNGTQIFLFAKYDQEIDCYVETRFDQASLRLRTVLNKSYNNFKAGYKAALPEIQKEIDQLKCNIDRLASREGNAKIVLCYTRSREPWHMKVLEHSDFRVSDNIYIVESDFINNIIGERDNLENNQLPPLIKDCPECHGSGYQKRNQIVSDEYVVECPNCNGTGKVWNWLTPEQYVSWMRGHGHPDYVMLDSDPVWVRMHIEEDWKIDRYKFDDGYHYMIVARLGQPAPPKDYKL